LDMVKMVSKGKFCAMTVGVICKRLTVDQWVLATSYIVDGRNRNIAVSPQSACPSLPLP
jgi:hypothetical protein